MEKFNRDLTKVAKGGGFSAIGDFFMVFSRLLMGIFTTHLFKSADRFGLFEWAFRVVFFIRIAVLPGTYEGIRRFMPIYRADGNRAAEKGLLLYALKLTGVLSLIVTSVVIIFAPQICALIGQEGSQSEAVLFLRVLAITLPFFAYLYVSAGAFTGIHKVHYQVWIEKFLVSGARLLILFVFMFAASQALRDFAVVWSYPITFGIGCFIAMFFFYKTFTVVRERGIKSEYHVRDFLKFSLPLAVTQPISYLLNYAGTFIIGYYCTAKDIGLYGIVTHLSPLLIVPLYSAIVVFGPLISELSHLGRKDELARHYKFITKWVFAISLLIFIMFLLLSKPILSIFGRDYADPKAQICLIIMGFAQLYNAANGPNGLLMAMTGRPHINLFNTALLMVTSVLLCILLVRSTGPLGGIIAAALAQAIAIVGVNTLYAIQIWHYHKMHPFSLEYLKPLVAGALSGGIVYGVMHFTGYNAIIQHLEPIGLSGYIGLILNIAGCGIILTILFTIILCLLGLQEEDKFILGKLIGKIRNIGLLRRPDANGAYHGRD
jgi:O-antigen/teichoic acid export membrane protein